MHEASHYIAEMYLSRGSAAPPKPWPGEGVRSLFVFFVPEDELCLYILEASSQDMVTNAGRRAGVPFDRVSAARLVHGNPHQYDRSTLPSGQQGTQRRSR
jgi:hypothetical protein